MTYKQIIKERYSNYLGSKKKQNAFEKLKEYLIKTPILLSYSDFTWSFIIYTNISSFGLSALSNWYYIYTDRFLNPLIYMSYYIYNKISLLFHKYLINTPYTVY